MLPRTLYIAALAIGLLSTASLRAEAQNIFVVNSTSDGSDTNPGDGVCQTTAGGCTLRAAIQEANASPNGVLPDSILFQFQYLPVSGYFNIYVGTPLPVVSEAVVIDATTAPAEVVIDGRYVQLPGQGGIVLGSGSSGSKVRGLTIGHFWNGMVVESHNNLVTDNYIGVRSDGLNLPNEDGIAVRGKNNTIGRPGHGNTIGFNENNGIRIFPYLDHIPLHTLIRGNYIGTDRAGRILPNRIGILVRAVNGTTIGGPDEADGNVIGNNSAFGIELLYAEETIVRNNYIGTDRAGRNLGNPHYGIFIFFGDNNTVGGLQRFGNTIGFNTIGIAIASSSDNKIRGNYIGTNAAGDDLGNGGGISIYGSSSEANYIGYGPYAIIPVDWTPGNTLGNTIAYNGDRGIRVVRDNNLSIVERNAIRGNRLHDNANQGIDLNGDGPSQNDAGDADSGPNGLMNYPDVTRAFYRPGSDAIVVEFSISSDPANAPYPLTVDAYLADDAVSGEGKTFIGSYSYATSGAVVQWEIPVDGIAWDALDYVVLTATDSLGNTSEFSPAQGPLDPMAVVGAAAGLVDRVDLADRVEGDGLGAAYPNPFNPQTTFTLSLAEASPAHVAVYDALGRQVALLHDGELSASTHTFTFDGAGLATGVYLLQVQTERFAETRRLILVR